MNEQLNKISRVHCSVNRHRLRSLFRAGVLGSVGVLFGAFGIGEVAALNNSWTNTIGGKWETGSSWSLVVPPTNTQSGIFITNVNTKTVTIDATTSGSFPGTMTISNLTLAGVGGFINTLSLSNASSSVPLKVLNSFTINSGGALIVTNSALIVDAGTMTINGSVNLQSGSIICSNANFGFGEVKVGSFAGTQGTLTIAGGTNSFQTLTIGIGGTTGTVWITGGQLRIVNPRIGYSGVGQMTVSNGTLQANNGGVCYVGVYATLPSQLGQGTLTIAGGTNQFSNLDIGYNIGTTGAVWVTGGQLVVPGGTFIGDGGVGQMTVSNGTVLAGAGSGGDLVKIGRAQTSPFPGSQGTLTIAGGTNNFTSGFSIGSAPFSTGTVWVTGGRLLTTNSFTSAIIGDSGFGQMTISNGTWLAGDVIIGSASGSTGTVTVTGGTLAITNAAGTATLIVGQSGRGSFIQSGGTVIVDQILLTNGANSILTYAGGTLTLRNTTVQGTLNVASGSFLTISSNLTVAPVANSTGDVMVTGGQLVVTGGVAGVGNSGTISSGLGVGRMTVSNATVLASTILLGSSVGGRGSLTIQSGGVVSFPGSNGVLSVNSLTVLGGALPVGVLDMVNGTIKVGVVSNGTMTVDGGIANCADVIVGEDTLGTCRMNDGTMTMASVLTVGNGSASTGVIWMNGGTWLSSSRATIGNNGTGQMTISNGNITLPRVVVSGIGASQNPGTFTIAGGAAYCTNLVVGFDVNSTGTVWVTGGELDVTNVAANAPLVVGRAGRALLTLSNGTLMVDQLVITNGAKSTFSFIRGKLKTRNTLVTNSAQFVVGDGINPATLNLLSGPHTFASGLKISTNTTFFGSGTVSNSVMNFGVMYADSGPLIFTRVVSNSALIVTNNMTFNGSVVNFGNGKLLDGTADGDGDGANNLSEAVAGTDPFNSASNFRIRSVAREGNDVRVTWSSVGGKKYVLQVSAGANGSYSNNFTDLSQVISVQGTGESSTSSLDFGTASIRARYYRVRIAP